VPGFEGDTVTTTNSSSTSTTLPDYAPVPAAAFGPALNEQGFYVGRIERNLYWVTDGVYASAFLTTTDGVVLLDAPASLGGNLRRAVDQIAAENGVTNKVTHLVYSHHHADHLGGSGLFDRDVVRVGHAETRRLLLGYDDPTRPAPDVTFEDRYTLQVGDDRVELAWHGTNHAADNIFIHLPDHDTLMLVDVVLPGWVPIYNMNVSTDLPGFLEAPGIALSYPWRHFIGGHLGRLGTREDVVVHQEYFADMAESIRTALATVDPTPFFMRYGANVWAGVKTYVDAVTDQAAAAVTAKYTGVLGAADVFTTSSTLALVESMRLDLGAGIPIHP
jgi:glyoxylase-like metal-dependent hydrolase (beta-lactamase superfamily II)